jgi:hypothetical protein
MRGEEIVKKKSGQPSAVPAPLADRGRAQTSLDPAAAGKPAMTLARMDEAKRKDWLARWDRNISAEYNGYRTCDTAMGEDIAWRTAPFVDGFYYGYMATGDAKYVDMLVDWTDSLIKRAVKEPDGYLGWPGKDGAGTWVDKMEDYVTDSMLSEAMLFRPVILMSGEIMKAPALKKKHGAKARSYIEFVEQLYEKWVKRGGWRETKDGGLISVVLPYGLDPTNTKWVDFETRDDPGRGASHPDNKANEVARWMLAMWDVTGKPEYKDRAERWFKLMKSRMKPKGPGAYEIWNYNEPAGPWDYKPDGTPKHWVGVHPNGGYYQLDTQGIVAAYEHGLVFARAEIDRLIATAKTSWTGSAWPGQSNQYYFDPSILMPGMLISVYPASGTAATVYACFPNSLTRQPASAGNGALNGTILSRTWDGSTGNIVVEPFSAPGTPMTVGTDASTTIWLLRMWSALLLYDVEIQRYYEALEKPDARSGVRSVPHYLMLQSQLSDRRPGIQPAHRRR